MPYQRALAHRLGFEPGSPDYETTALSTDELSRILRVLWKRLLTILDHRFEQYKPFMIYFVIYLLNMTNSLYSGSM